MEFPSKIVERAVEEIAKLPGIGKKTALRLALHLLRQPLQSSENLSDALITLRKKIKYCNVCHIIADIEDCTCKTNNRDTSVICVVEDTPDVIAIRSTGQYNGLFHVLGGRISPIDGIGPEQIHVSSLVERIQQDKNVKEIILALSATIEGDTTAYYITKLLTGDKIKITTIARGISIGSELEFADEITLGRSITARTLFSDSH